MILYHTTTLEVQRPDTLHSRKRLDFGKGFYLTAMREQAVDLYLAGIYTREQALDQLRYKQPNHQICITSQEVLDKHIRFIHSIQL